MSGSLPKSKSYQFVVNRLHIKLEKKELMKEIKYGTYYKMVT